MRADRAHSPHSNPFFVNQIMSDTLLADLKNRLPVIEAFERAYRLPTVAGTERQCAWARMIRVEFIRLKLDTGLVSS